MCKNNENGRTPSCLEAKFDGPGCEDWDLCSECAGVLKAQKDEALVQVAELRKALEAVRRIFRESNGADHSLAMDRTADIALKLIFAEKRKCEVCDYLLSDGKCSCG
jgi:hypothetical protein